MFRLSCKKPIPEPITLSDVPSVHIPFSHESSEVRQNEFEDDKIELDFS